MTRYAPLWQQNSTYPASTDRGLLSALWPTGGVTGGAVTAQLNTMNALVASGTAAVPTVSNQGTMLCRWDATETVTLAAAPPSGSTRIDVIVLQVRDATLDAGSNNDFIFQGITGTPTTGTPVAPAVPASALAMAQVLVPGAAANLNAAVITDVRPSGPMSLSGAFAAPVGAGSPLVTKTDANGVLWVAKGGVSGGAWRQARDVLHARMMRTAVFTLGTASAGIQFDTTDFDVFGMWSPAYASFITPVSGLWLVSGQIYAVTNAANQSLGIAIGKFGSSIPIARGASGAQPVITGVYALISQTVKLSAGDQVQIWASSSPVSLSTTYADPANIFGVCQYVGTG